MIPIKLFMNSVTYYDSTEFMMYDDDGSVSLYAICPLSCSCIIERLICEELAGMWMYMETSVTEVEVVQLVHLKIKAVVIFSIYMSASDEIITFFCVSCYYVENTHDVCNIKSLCVATLTGTHLCSNSMSMFGSAVKTRVHSLVISLLEREPWTSAGVFDICCLHN